MDFLKPIKDALAWFVNLLSDMALGLVELVWPGFDPIALGPIADAVAAANQYIPLDLLFLLTIAYFAQVLAFALTKITVKLVPFIG